jgi:hypothetical protein
MTHPAWPSNEWQIYSSDYDTPAAYYAVAKACEPLHAQMNLPDFRLAVVNVTRNASPSLKLRSRVLSLDNRLLLQRVDRLDAAANATTTLQTLDLAALLERERVLIVVLTLTDRHDAVLSTNFYWQAREDADLKRLTGLAQQPLELSARSHAEGDNAVVDIRLKNPGRVPALLAKLTLLDAGGNRVLPAFYSDNYLSLLPGESRTIRAQCPAAGIACAAVALRGWNVAPGSVSVTNEGDK